MVCILKKRQMEKPRLMFNQTNPNQMKTVEIHITLWTSIPDGLTKEETAVKVISGIGETLKPDLELNDGFMELDTREVKVYERK